MLGIKDIYIALRTVFGGGADISAANPLPVNTSTHLSLKCVAAEVPAGEVYYVSSGEVWGVLALVVEGELRIDGETHCWGDVTGDGTITGEGELRLH